MSSDRISENVLLNIWKEHCSCNHPNPDAFQPGVQAECINAHCSELGRPLETSVLLRKRGLKSNDYRTDHSNRLYVLPTMHITDIPVEIFLDNLFPFAEVRDVLRLGSTNKFFAALCADETFWRKKCQEEFNFTSQETARQSGWKNLYRGLNRPRVFVWGSVIRLVHRSQVVTRVSLQ